jgi:hypothetical protein
LEAADTTFRSTCDRGLSGIVEDEARKDDEAPRDRIGAGPKWPMSSRSSAGMQRQSS